MTLDIYSMLDINKTSQHHVKDLLIDSRPIELKIYTSTHLPSTIVICQKEPKYAQDHEQCEKCEHCRTHSVGEFEECEPDDGEKHGEQRHNHYGEGAIS